MLVRILIFISVGILSISVATASCRDSVEIEYGLKTIHLVSDRSSRNEDNEFTGLSVDCFTISKFINSHYHSTYSMGYRFDINRNFGIGAGIIRGYDANKFPKIMRVDNDNTIWYATAEVSLWGDQLLPILGYNHSLLRHLGIRVRQSGEVSQILSILRWEF